MKLSKRQKSELREVCPYTSVQVRKLAQDYMARTGLTFSSFSTEIGYSRAAFKHFMYGRYMKLTGAKSDLSIRATVYGYIQKYPVNGDAEKPLPKKLYPTFDTKLVLERLDDARRSSQFVIFEGPPGTSKSVLSRYYEAERNRKVKHDVFRVLAYPEMTGHSLLKRVSRKVGAYVGASIEQTLTNAERALKKHKPCLIIIDEAQFLLDRNDTPFEMLRSLCDRTGVGCALFSHFRFIRALTNGRAADLEQWLSRFDFHYQLRGLKKADLPGIARDRLEASRLPPGLVEILEEVSLVRDRNSAARSRGRPSGVKRLPANYYSFRRLDKFFERVVYLRSLPGNDKASLLDLADEAAELLLSSSGSAF